MENGDNVFLQPSGISYDNGYADNDVIWSDTAYSFYENQELGPNYGSGAKPLKKFGFQFGNKIIKLRVVKKSILEKRRYFCKFCPDAYFDTEREHKEHSMTHTASVIKRKCGQCDVQYVSSRALAIHCRFVHGETMGYKCDLCAKQFTKKHYLILHTKTHEIGDRFYCKKCGNWYRKQEELIEHEAFCDKGKRGRYGCTFCDKVFSYPRDKILHERTHTGEKPFTCLICGAQFSQPSALTVHGRTHTGERKYGCRFCPVRFVDSSAARRHEIRLHMEEVKRHAEP